MNYMFVEYLNMKLNLGKQSEKEMLAYLFVLSLLALLLFTLLVYINVKDKKRKIKLNNIKDKDDEKIEKEKTFEKESFNVLDDEDINNEKGKTKEVNYSQNIKEIRKLNNLKHNREEIEFQNETENKVDQIIDNSFTKKEEIAENFEGFYGEEIRYTGANYVLDKDIKTMDDDPMFLENQIKEEEAKILRELEMKSAISKLENVLNKKLKTDEDIDG